MFGRLNTPEYPTLSWMMEMIPKIYTAFPNNQSREVDIRIDKQDKGLFLISFYDDATGYYFSFRILNKEIVDIKNDGVCMF